VTSTEPQAPGDAAPLRLEIIVLDVDDALRAQAGGADRIEVVSDIDRGGLTPSASLVHGIARQCQLPQMVMLRPHDRSFVYSDEDMQQIREAVAMVRDAGAQGLVFGALTPAGAIDIGRLDQVLRWADGLPVTFHRAFDAAVDLALAFSELTSYRGAIAQVLTSGGAPTASPWSVAASATLPWPSCAITPGRGSSMSAAGRDWAVTTACASMPCAWPACALCSRRTHWNDLAAAPRPARRRGQLAGLRRMRARSASRQP
jgi:hypothetical protein